MRPTFYHSITSPTSPLFLFQIAKDAHTISYSPLSPLSISQLDEKVGMIKWMVGFWIAQMAAIIGLYIKK